MEVPLLGLQIGPCLKCQCDQRHVRVGFSDCIYKPAIFELFACLCKHPSTFLPWNAIYAAAHARLSADAVPGVSCYVPCRFTGQDVGREVIQEGVEGQRMFLFDTHLR